jgi:hypothetical protein
VSPPPATRSRTRTGSGTHSIHVQYHTPTWRRVLLLLPENGRLETRAPMGAPAPPPAAPTPAEAALFGAFPARASGTRQTAGDGLAEPVRMRVPREKKGGPAPRLPWLSRDRPRVAAVCSTPLHRRTPRARCGCPARRFYPVGLHHLPKCQNSYARLRTFSCIDVSTDEEGLARS